MINIGDGFRSGDGGESAGVRRIGVDEIIQATQQRHVQQPMAGDKLLAVSARSHDAQKRFALRSRTNTWINRDARRDPIVFESDVLGELQRAILTGDIRGKRSRRHGEAIRKLVRRTHVLRR